ncbi:MAG: hypothetical protein BWX88_04301 [Planctomycetes bacterium ADurb.Bin126]|nr:MAG: hypothetical protein BWX88_04301 [Planctomycetes bacterium ADurb.Bin126]
MLANDRAGNADIRRHVDALADAQHHARPRHHFGRELAVHQDLIVPRSHHRLRADIDDGPRDGDALAGDRSRWAADRTGRQIDVGLGGLDELERTHVRELAAAIGHTRVWGARVVVARGAHVVGGWSHRAVGRIDHRADVAEAVVTTDRPPVLRIDRHVAVDARLVAVARRGPDVAVLDRRRPIWHARRAAVTDDGVGHRQRAAVWP